MQTHVDYTYLSQH